MTDYFDSRIVGAQGNSAPQVTRYARLTGGALSAALILGAGVWGYELVKRSIMGVPVITSPAEPARIQPETPGGEQATFQGFAVNELIAEGGVANPPDRILLAPPTTPLAEEDLPAGMIKVEEEADPVLARQLVINAVISQVLNVSPDGGIDGAEGEATSSLLPAVDADSGTVIRSPLPVERPLQLDTEVVAEVVSPDGVAILTTPARELDPSEIKPGARLAQLGAFDSADEARDAWGKLHDTFSDFLAGRDYVIQTAENGGRMIYRLRTTGFESMSDARRFCAALSAEKAECIPVVIR